MNPTNKSSLSTLSPVFEAILASYGMIGQTGNEQYQDAMKFLDAAVEAADQAHAILKQLKCDYAARPTGYRKQSLPDLVSDLESLRNNFLKATCDDCGRLLSEHTQLPEDDICRAAIEASEE